MFKKLLLTVMGYLLTQEEGIITTFLFSKI